MQAETCGREIGFIRAALAADWAVPMGPDVTAFEKKLGAVVGTENVVALESGTSAIHLARILCGARLDNEVIVPSMIFCASTNPNAYLGVTPTRWLN